MSDFLIPEEFKDRFVGISEKEFREDVSSSAIKREEEQRMSAWLALLLFDSELKPILKKEKLTTRDSRSVERKKYGHRKARRSFQFSKR